jgi:hypothetical protein
MPPDDQNTGRKRQGLQAVCNDYVHYIPDSAYLDHYTTRYVNLEFHFMNTSDSTLNFNRDEGIQFIHELVESINEFYKNNKQMWLPLGNNTPVRPINIQCRIAPNPNIVDDLGIYFHYDDSLYYIVTRGQNRNNTDMKVIQRYKTRDSLISVFIMPHHRDSIASETYTPYESGISLRGGIKMAGIYENNRRHGNQSRGLLAHELGHAFGLSHTWPGYDGCDDTPAHTNCWNFSKIPPCDTEVSNNVMDYNPYQAAFTPCQIGKMHLNFSRFNSSQRLFTEPNWCQLDTSKTIYIRDTIEWFGSKDLCGNLIIEEGARLSIHCRVSMPEFSKIYIMPGGQLHLKDAWLHNSCNFLWDGIEIGIKGKSKGQVIIQGETRIENTTKHPEIKP